MVAVTRREYAGAAAATTLSSDITNSSTSISVDDATNWPTGTNPFYIVIDEGTSSEEKILCSSRSGNTLTVSSRGADDTAATSHDAGASVKHVWTAQDADDTNKVAAALTTKGDLLGFGTEPTRIPVGADGTVPVADSTDAEGLAWKSGAGSSIDADLLDGVQLAALMGSLEVDGSTEVASVSLSGTISDAATVTLTIPAGWGGYRIEAYATFALVGSLQDSTAVPFETLISIAGTAQQILDSTVVRETSGQPIIPGAVGGRRTGMTTTGNVDVKLRGSGGEIRDIFLYARAVRTS